MQLFRKDPLLALFRLSLAFAAVIFAHALLIGRSVADIVADIWELIFMCPALIGFYRFGIGAIVRPILRSRQAPRSEDAERSSRLVSGVGRRFVIGIALVPLLIQAVWITGIVGIPQVVLGDPDLVVRGVFLLVGGLIVYFGNVIPKTPAPAGADPAVFRLRSRLLGWTQVIHGLLTCIGALLLSVEDMAWAWTAAIGSMLVCSVLAILLPRLLKPAKGR